MKKTNSICSKCYWGDQCGEDTMNNCGFFDDIDNLSLQDGDCTDNISIDNYIELKRKSFQREWEEYMTGFYYENGRCDYDA